jgi:hypothetical protein
MAAHGHRPGAAMVTRGRVVRYAALSLAGHPAILWRTIQVVRGLDGRTFLSLHSFTRYFVAVNRPDPYLDRVARNRNSAMNRIA